MGRALEVLKGGWRIVHLLGLRADLFKFTHRFVYMCNFAAQIFSGYCGWAGDEGFVITPWTLIYLSFSLVCTGIQSIVGNDDAFAALTITGEVITLGNEVYGGDLTDTVYVNSQLASYLRSDVQSIYANGKAFTALRSDGTMVSWGNPKAGGGTTSIKELCPTLICPEGIFYNPALVNIKSVYGNKMAFAARLNDYSLISWGNQFYGGYHRIKFRQFANVYANAGAFVAVSHNGSLYAFGDPTTGGNLTFDPAEAVSMNVTKSLLSGIDHVAATSAAFAVVANDGVVYAWGHNYYGGLNGPLFTAHPTITNARALFANNGAFAALSAHGEVWTWGESNSGGDYSMSTAVAANLKSGVVTIYATWQAFAALKDNGDVVTWGFAKHGGDAQYVNNEVRGVGLVSLPVLANITKICANQVAFLAIDHHNYGHTWGYELFGGRSRPFAPLRNLHDCRDRITAPTFHPTHRPTHHPTAPTRYPTICE